MNASRIRKQVDQLTAQDFDVALFGSSLSMKRERRARTRPLYDHTPSTEISMRQQVCSSRGRRFALSDGTILQGYVTPPVEGDFGLGTLQPVVLARNGRILFWFGRRDPGKPFISELYSRMGKASASQVFPIQFESTVPLVGGPVRGEIPGFLILEDIQTGRTRVVA